MTFGYCVVFTNSKTPLLLATKMDIQGCGARDVPVTLYLVGHSRDPKPISLERFEHISCGYNTEPLIADSSGIALCEECIRRFGLKPFEQTSEA
jgi:hypothetical protein